MRRVVLVAVLLVGCSSKPPVEPLISASGWTLSSPTLALGGEVEGKYRGDGVSPPLSWDMPTGKVASVALVVEDPDAPGEQPFVHWMVVGLPVKGGLPEGGVPPGAVVGVNSLGNMRYFGPNPPEGTHEYHFRIYALKVIPKLKPGFNRADLAKAMEGRVVDQTELVVKASAR